jgi:hypothetical protein
MKDPFAAQNDQGVAIWQGHGFYAGFAWASHPSMAG